MSQNSQLVGVRMPGSLKNVIKGSLKRSSILQLSPRMANFQQGDVLISFFLPSTHEQGSEQSHFSLTVRQRGRIL